MKWGHTCSTRVFFQFSGLCLAESSLQPMFAFLYFPAQMKECSHYIIESNPTDHASTPPRFTAPLRLYASTVNMPLRAVMAMKHPRAKRLSVTWLHSSFELCRTCPTDPTRPYIQGLIGPTWPLKDLQNLERMDVFRPVWGGPSQTGSVSREKIRNGAQHSASAQE